MALPWIIKNIPEGGHESTVRTIADFMSWSH